MPIGYKILTKQRYLINCGRLSSYTGRWGSYNTYFEGRIGNQVYELNKWTERKKGFGPLALFDDYYMALEYLGSYNPDKKIAICEYVLSEDKELWTVDEYNHTVFLHERQLPYGTILADKIKILEYFFMYCENCGSEMKEFVLKTYNTCLLIQYDCKVCTHCIKAYRNKY